MTPKEKKTNKERARGNNLLIQEMNAIFHENVKNKNVLFLSTSFF